MAEAQRVLTSTQESLLGMADVRKQELIMQNVTRDRIEAWYAGAVYRITEMDLTCCQCGQHDISMERFLQDPFIATCSDECQKNLDNQRHFLFTKSTQLFTELQEVENLMREVLKDKAIVSTGSHVADQNAVPRNDLDHRQSSISKLITQYSEAMLMCDRGTYGVCVECHEKIDPKRLSLVPSTKMCKDCKAEKEREDSLPNGHGGRTPRNRLRDSATM